MHYIQEICVAAQQQDIAKLTELKAKGISLDIFAPGEYGLSASVRLVLAGNLAAAQFLGDHGAHKDWIAYGIGLRGLNNWEGDYAALQKRYQSNRMHICGLAQKGHFKAAEALLMVGGNEANDWLVYGAAMGGHTKYLEANHFREAYSIASAAFGYALGGYIQEALRLWEKIKKNPPPVPNPASGYNAVDAKYEELNLCYQLFPGLIAIGAALNGRWDDAMKLRQYFSAEFLSEETFQELRKRQKRITEFTTQTWAHFNVRYVTVGEISLLLQPSKLFADAKNVIVVPTRNLYLNDEIKTKLMTFLVGDSKYLNSAWITKARIFPRKQLPFSAGTTKLFAYEKLAGLEINREPPTSLHCLIGEALTLKSLQIALIQRQLKLKLEHAEQITNVKIVMPLMSVIRFLVYLPQLHRIPTDMIDLVISQITNLSFEAAKKLRLETQFACRKYFLIRDLNSYLQHWTCNYEEPAKSLKQSVESVTTHDELRTQLISHRNFFTAQGSTYKKGDFYNLVAKHCSRFGVSEQDGNEVRAKVSPGNN